MKTISTALLLLVFILSFVSEVSCIWKISKRQTARQVPRDQTPYTEEQIKKMNDDMMNEIRRKNIAEGKNFSAANADLLKQEQANFEQLASLITDSKNPQKVLVSLIQQHEDWIVKTPIPSQLPDMSEEDYQSMLLELKGKSSSSNPSHDVVAMETSAEEKLRTQAQARIAMWLKGGGMCWKKSYTRGVGTIPDACTNPNKPEMQTGLCYARCPSGWSGEGPVCWKPCERSYTDIGWLCSYSDWHFYGKGCCCTVFGCCGCPSTHTDTGCTCHIRTPCYAQPSQGRGVGIIPTGCSSNQENNAGLCYPKCGKGYYGVAFVCWQQCGGNFPVDCGMACAATTADCTTGTMDMITGPIMLALDVATGGTVGSALQGLKSGVTALSTAVKTGMKTALKSLIKGGVAKLSKGLSKEALKKSLKEMAKSTGEFVKDAFIEDCYDKIIKFEITGGEEIPEYDLESLTMLDPTGISSIVLAYANPICDTVVDPEPETPPVLRSQVRINKREPGPINAASVRVTPNASLENPPLVVSSASGLVLLYKFEEIKGTVVRDSSGNNFHGTIAGNISMGLGGQNGNAFKFDNGEITIPNGAFASLKTDVTIMAWIKTDPSNQDSSFFWANSALCNRHMSIKFDSSAKFDSGCGTGGTFDRVNTPVALSNSAFTHWAFVRSNNMTSIFVNGRLVNQTNAAKSFSASTFSKISLGNGDGKIWKGVVDEFSIYSVALSSGDITSIIKSSRYGLLVTYNFEDRQGTVAKDSSGRDYDGDIVGTGFVWELGSKSGSGLSLSGARLKIDPASLSSVVDEFSILAMVKANNSGPSVFFRVKAGSNCNKFINIELPTSANVVTFESGCRTNGLPDSLSGAFPANGLASNTFNHWAFVRKQSTMTIYLNGIIVLQREDAGGNINSRLVSLLNVTLGGDEEGNVAFKGTVDDFMIFNRALDAREIKDVIFQTGLVLYYRFEETTGQKIKDLSLNGNDGELKDGGNIVATTGKIGNSISLTAGYISAPPRALDKIENEITLMTWTKGTRPLGGLLFQIIPNSLCNRFLSVDFLFTDGQVYYDSGCNSWGGYDRVGGYKVSWDSTNFVHWAFVRRGNVASIFINGKQVAVNSQATSPFVAKTSTFSLATFSIGKKVKVNLDEFIVYNRGLTPDEIRKYIKWSSSSGMLVGFSMDEIQGSILADEMGLNNGKIERGICSMGLPGVVGNAVQLKGGEINIPVETLNTVTNQITVMAWIKTSPLSQNQEFLSVSLNTTGLCKKYLSIVFSNRTITFTLGCANGANDTLTVVPISGIDSNNFNHWAFTRMDNTIAIYCNGTKIASSNNNTKSFVASSYPLQDLRISNAVSPWRGVIDEFFIFSKALNETAISFFL